MSSDASLAVVRQFQSETDAICEAPRPIATRLTIFLLAAVLASSTVLMFVTNMDRIVVSVNVAGANPGGGITGGGKIVTTAELLNVYQPLDNSIIKSIEVREGEQVVAGQLLATLDQTFADADVYQYKLQLASSEAQIARDEAELTGSPLVFRPTTDPDFLKYQATQNDYYEQHVAQYTAQTSSFDAKIKQYQATLQKFEGDAKGYKQREEVASQIEHMRNTLASSGNGSQLNLWLATDARLETLRLLDNTRNSLLEAKQTLAALEADREAFVRQWSASLNQELVTARGAQSTEAPGAGPPDCFGARRGADHGQGVRGICAADRQHASDADAAECAGRGGSHDCFARYRFCPSRRSLPAQDRCVQLH